QVLDVGRCEVQPLGARRRDDVAGVSRQKHAPEAKGLGNEAAERRDDLLKRRARNETLATLVVEAKAKLLPEYFVGPLVDVVGDRHLQVVAAARVTALRAQCESPRTVDVDELFGHGRRVRKQPEPAKRIDLLVLGDRFARRTCATDAVKAVA